MLKSKILKLREEGKTYKEIANILHCSKSVISFHCSKLHNNIELIENNIVTCKEEKKLKAKTTQGVSNKEALCKICNNKFFKKYDAHVYCKTECYIKGKEKDKCPKCGGQKRVISNQCINCRNKGAMELALNHTIKELKDKLSVKGKHPSWANAELRNFCRIYNKDLLKHPCQNCKYDKHVELCHIKAISYFPETATLLEVNSKSNILVLCRNCHWEFDKGLIHPNPKDRKE